MKITICKSLLAIALLMASFGQIAAQPIPGPVPMPNVAPRPSTFQQRLTRLMSSGGSQSSMPPKLDELISTNWTAHEPGWRHDFTFNGLPISEVAKQMKETYSNSFDVLLPTDWRDQTGNAPIDPPSTQVTLTLKEVTATEAFNAMNLEFEAENKPVRWELMANGERPLAVLRVYSGLVPQSSSNPPEKLRMVYFIGDLVDSGDSKSDSVRQIFESVKSIYDAAYGPAGPSGQLQYHDGTQMLIVTAPIDELHFIEQTLKALRDKRQFDSFNKAARQAGASPPANK